jgi:segregation and condensation protein A
MTDLPVQRETLGLRLPLFLELVKKGRVNVFEIRISSLIDAFATYLEEEKAIDMRLVEEFVELVSLLLYRKSRMLIYHELEGEVEIEERSDEEMVKRERLKEMVEALLAIPRLGEAFFLRGGLRPEGKENLLLLSETMKEMVRRRERPITVAEMRPTIAEKLEALKARLKEVGFFLWPEKGKSRLENITTFLAILELVRARVASILQRRAFGRIFVRRRGA